MLLKCTEFIFQLRRLRCRSLFLSLQQCAYTTPQFPSAIPHQIKVRVHDLIKQLTRVTWTTKKDNPKIFWPLYQKLISISANIVKMDFLRSLTSGANHSIGSYWSRPLINITTIQYELDKCSHRWWSLVKNLWIEIFGTLGDPSTSKHSPNVLKHPITFKWRGKQLRRAKPVTSWNKISLQLLKIGFPKFTPFCLVLKSDQVNENKSKCISFTCIPNFFGRHPDQLCWPFPFVFLKNKHLHESKLNWDLFLLSLYKSFYWSTFQLHKYLN